MRWDGSALVIDIDEVTVPSLRRLQGTVRLIPSALTGQAFALDSAARHTWWPIAPAARVEVELGKPSISWSGTGYLDTNSGCEPLDAAFGHWHWSRAKLAQEMAVLYDVCQADGARSSLAIRIDQRGEVHQIERPPTVDLPRSRWRIERKTAADAPDVRVLRTLEDGPFYARSLLQTRLLGEKTIAMHESLSLDRFSKPWVKGLLPFRMPRALRQLS
jgi:carotenoid 1,2-hydratase